MEERIINAFKAACWDNPYKPIWVTYTAINRAVNQKWMCRGSIIERHTRKLTEKGILLKRKGNKKVEFTINPNHPAWRQNK